MRKITLCLSLCLFVFAQVNAKVYYLAPNGSDTNDGLTWETAWGTPAKVATTLQAGDTCWTKGGTYTVHATVKAKNDGTQQQPVCWYAVKGELPVFDCSSFRNYGSENSTYRGLDLRRNYWHVKGMKIYKAGHNGIIIAGENIIVEGCIIEQCGHDGISIGSGSVNALVLNCDSYRNADTGNKGENGDGFAAKEGIGTVFRGCRAWENVDDGWDVYGGSEPVLIDSCWSFGNGQNFWQDYISTFQGDGNGFKLGGGGGVDGNAPNVVLNSFAFNNVSKGFDQNHNAWGVTCINCTGYNNNGIGNFAFAEVPAKGQHVMINNLSYAGTGQNIAAGSVETTNSWNMGLNFTADMFESLNCDDAKLPRDENYRLSDPRIEKLFQLKSNNPAINKGTIQTSIRLKPHFALPYYGAAPDLGAKEYVEGLLIQPEPEEGTPDFPGSGEERPDGDCTDIITHTEELSIKKKTSTLMWGPFSLAKGCTASMEMKAVGSSSAAVVIEFSADGNTWTQVGTQVKNGSSGSYKSHVVNLNSDTAPWGPSIYVRLNNKTNNDAYVKNLLISAQLYNPSQTSVESTEDELLRVNYYDLFGRLLSSPRFGLLLKQSIYRSGKTTIEKVLYY